MNVEQLFALVIKTPPIRKYTLATYKPIIAATFKRGWARSPLRLSREETFKATLSSKLNIVSRKLSLAGLREGRSRFLNSRNENIAINRKWGRKDRTDNSPIKSPET